MRVLPKIKDTTEWRFRLRKEATFHTYILGVSHCYLTESEFAALKSLVCVQMKVHLRTNGPFQASYNL